MSTFYDPGPIPGWPIGRPAGAGPGPDALPMPTAPAESGMSNSGTPATATGATARRALEPSHPPAELSREREERVRALRDAVQGAAERLQSTEPLSLRDFHETVYAACAALQPGDLGTDGATVGQQFEAFFERLRKLADAHAEPVPTTSLGLDADAGFLKDMAEFITSNYALQS
jgi:hypothetical protein